FGPYGCPENLSVRFFPNSAGSPIRQKAASSLTLQQCRKRYTDGQEDQLGALGLVTNAVVLWNTIYMQAALDHLRAQGETLNDEDIARLSPLCHGHINMLGHYSFTLAELVTKGHLRPLKEASEAENVA
ncbi:Tn3 family transposase, partial [Escherichia coli]|nr:Tn3 family transposase [Escherichia coli]